MTAASRRQQAALRAASVEPPAFMIDTRCVGCKLFTPMLRGYGDDRVRRCDACEEKGKTP